MPERSSPRPRPRFGVAVRDALDRQELGAMLPPNVVDGDEPAAAASADQSETVVTPTSLEAAAAPASRPEVAAPRKGRTRARRILAPPEEAQPASDEASVEAVPATAQAVQPLTEPEAAVAEVPAAVEPDGTPAVDTLSAEVRRLQGDIEVLRTRVRRRVAEGYELPILIVLAAVLVAVIVYQLVRG